MRQRRTSSRSSWPDPALRWHSDMSARQVADGAVAAAVSERTVMAPHTCAGGELWRDGQVGRHLTEAGGQRGAVAGAARHHQHLGDEPAHGECDALEPWTQAGQIRLSGATRGGLPAGAGWCRAHRSALQAARRDFTSLASPSSVTVCSTSAWKLCVMGLCTTASSGATGAAGDPPPTRVTPSGGMDPALCTPALSPRCDQSLAPPLYHTRTHTAARTPGAASRRPRATAM